VARDPIGAGIIDIGTVDQRQGGVLDAVASSKSYAFASARSSNLGPRVIVLRTRL